MDLRSLVRKYSVSGPRYTSYPTAPQWNETVGTDAYRRALEKGLPEGATLGMYVHVPFCEALCYYCGCNIQITSDHKRSASYVESLIDEANEVARFLGRRTLTQISWGGGTPTFLSTEEIGKLYRGLTRGFDVANDADISIEVDPRVTSREQLRLLRALGFTRVSLGVQDFDPQVQKAVNRVQSAEMTAGMLDTCRLMGYRGINFDLIYGLPLQTLTSFERTVGQVVEMRPDRIALFNYARLPSLLPHQKIIEKFPMPDGDDRLDIFTMAYERLRAAGYIAIGMDHFALETDELARAVKAGTLYRNFMGYVDRRGTDLVGIGASAIGEIGDAYFQNLKKASEYEAAVGREGLATMRGCLLSDDDRRRKWVIQRLMCGLDLRYGDYEREFGESFRERFGTELEALGAFEADAIVERRESGLSVTEMGRLFIRNVAMTFDAYLKSASGATYSRTV